MPVIEIRELNGADGDETVLARVGPDGIEGRLDFISVDTPSGKPAEHRIRLASSLRYSYEKWLRMVVTEIESGIVISGIKVWYSQEAPSNSDTLKTNARTSSYAAATYAPPTNLASVVATEDLPDEEPATANVGIDGSLSGEMTAPGDQSDLLVLQVGAHPDTRTPPIRTLHVSWQES